MEVIAPLTAPWVLVTRRVPPVSDPAEFFRIMAERKPVALEPNSAAPTSSYFPEVRMKIRSLVVVLSWEAVSPDWTMS
jgi:hypothetical protein